MPRKKIVREPVEKISDNEQLTLIEESSDDEPAVEAPKPKKRAPPKAKVACQFCGKEYSKAGIRLTITARAADNHTRTIHINSTGRTFNG